MTSIRSLALYLLTGLLLVSAGGCSDSGEVGRESAEALTSDSGILRFIPADSPYVLVAAEPLPDDVRETLQAKSADVIRAYGKMLRAALHGKDEAERSDMPPEFDALVAEFTRIMTPEGMEASGISRRPTMAVYGHQLWPVVRISLDDEAAMEATLARFESGAGEEMPTASLDGHDYRYVEGKDGNMLVIAVLDDYLVAGFLPATPSDDRLKSVLGLDLPQSDIAESGRLATLAEAYDYTAYGLGFIDVEQIARVMLDGESDVSRALLADAGIDQVSEVCRTEALALAGIAPRIVAGYTEITGKRIVSNSVIELRQDIAKALTALTAPVPGLGQEREAGLVTFGMSLNPQAARDFYAARLDALEAEPYECEWFADVQEGVAGGREMLQQPWPPVVYSFRGFVASINDLRGMDIQGGQPPTDVDMQLLLATDNAEALVAMGAMFSPDIAALDLKPDGKPVQLPVPAFAQQIKAAHVAMSDSALALSIGAGNEARLPAMLAAPVATPSPFISSDIDAAAYYGFVADATMQADGDEEASPEFQQAFREVMTGLQALFSRLTVDVYFTERGIEIPSTAELKD